jgi:uncharacterized membrane protein
MTNAPDFDASQQPTTPPAYPAPAPYQHTPPQYLIDQRKVDGFAVAALVLGIVWGFWLGSILAVIFGHVAISRIRRQPNERKGHGLAVAGLVLGYVGVATLILFVLLPLAAASS